MLYLDPMCGLALSTTSERAWKSSMQKVFNKNKETQVSQLDLDGAALLGDLS